MYTCGWAYKFILSPEGISDLVKVNPFHGISKSQTYFLGSGLKGLWGIGVKSWLYAYASTAL
jgi:hypothetical protein